MKKTFLVVYEKGKRNYGGFAPDVPGCISLGDTLEVTYVVEHLTVNIPRLRAPKTKLPTDKKTSSTKRRALQAA